MSLGKNDITGALSGFSRIQVWNANGILKVIGGGTPPPPTPVVWGSITGTVTNQTDLISYLSSNFYPLSSNPAGYLTQTTADSLYYPLSSNPAGYITSAALTGYVPTTRTLTINGTSYDLSADRSWTIAAGGTVTSVELAAGTGISLSGTNPILTSGIITVTNSAPDQVVVLTGGTGISTSGTYPNFTITNTSPDQTVVLTAGTAIGITGTYPSFTINNTAPDQTVVLTPGTGIGITGTYPSFTITNSSPASGVTLTSAGGTETLVNDGTGPSLATKGLTASTGISLSSTSSAVTITNAAPDQVVSLSTTGTGLAVTGTYPSFTLQNTLPDQTVVLTQGGTTTITGTYPSFTISSADQYTGTVTSVGLSAPAAFTVSNSPVTGAGNLTFTGAGTSAQYIDGTGALQTLPTPGLQNVITQDPVLTTDNTINGGGFIQTFNNNYKFEIEAEQRVQLTSFNSPKTAIVWASTIDESSQLYYDDGTKDSYVRATGSRLDVGTPLVATKTIGDVLTLVDPTTGEAEWQTPSSGGGIPFGTASGTDTYTVTISGVSSYVDGDAYIIRFTNGNTTGSTLNINSIGAVSLYKNNHSLIVGGDIWDGMEMICIYDSVLTGFSCIGTSPNSLFSYVTNDDTVTITKGQPVYASGGTGDRLKVKLAYNTSDATSAQTVGLVFSSSIATNQKGIIIMQGLLSNLSILPTSTWSDGSPVYLGTTAGAITPTKQYAPNHLVYLGFVTTASNGNAGRLYVRPQNGYEMDELHNVQAQSPADKDTLWYDNSVTPKQWKTASIPTILGYTPQAQLNGTGFVKASGTTISYDNSTYLTSAITSLNGLTGAIQTFTNDTNVTITSSGTAHALGWTGTLADARIASATNWNTAYTNRITSLTTTGTSGAATLSSNTLNIPQYQGVLTLTTTGSSGAATLVGNTLNIPQYAGGVSGSVATIGTNIDGSGGTITVGQKGYVQVPYGCTITSWRIIANASGSIVIDIWKAASPTIPTVANTITASAKPTLSSAQTNASSTLTGWTTSIAANDILGFNVDSATTVSWVILQIFVTKT